MPWRAFPPRGGFLPKERKVKSNLLTSEAVAEGHPDKVCDQIADALLDAVLEQDKDAHTAFEVFATKEYVLIGGEVTAKAVIDYEKITRGVLRDIGYSSAEVGIGAESAKIDVRVQEQSPDIARGVERLLPEEMGAGDQGIMFGYATKETEGYMPLPISIAQKLVRVASDMRKRGEFPHSRPDMKSQVTIDYDDPLHPRLYKVLMSCQHDPDINFDEFCSFVQQRIMIPVARSFHLNDDFEVLVNPTGRFVIGGPAGDTGLTGRKLIVDTYGGASRHGGGSFSGKDPSKVDRSGSYYARYIAKNLVAAGVADRLEVQLSYAIGKPDPMSIGISTYGTSHYSDVIILEAIERFFDARPGMIIQELGLRNGIKYRPTSTYGAFGRPDLALPWERLDKVEEIKDFLEKNH